MALLKNKEKQIIPEYVASEINTPMLNYCTYKMKGIEIVLYFGMAFIIGGIVGLVFYANLFMVDGEPTMATYISNIIIFCGIGYVTASKFLPMRAQQLCEKRQDVLKLQFREMLAALATAFSAGENLLGAFQSVQKEMTAQFGDRSYIAVEVSEILESMNSNIPVERALNNFAVRSGLEDVESFANIMGICYQKGGNMKSVVRNTYDLIGEKITIGEEIKTKLTSNQMQQNFMSIIPIILIGYLRVSSSSFAESFASFTGVIVMTIAAGIFIGSYMYGKKITNIRG